MLVLAVPASAARPPDASRAIASYVAMERSLFDTESGTYRDAQAWPVSQAVSATIAVASIPGARTDAAAHAALGFRQLGSLRQGALYEAQTGASIYYDDNEWIAQDLLDWNDFRHDPGSVADAKAIFAGVVKAWDDDGATPCPGGVYWTTAADIRDRNTVSTANGALVGLRLYARTHDPALLYWSRRMLDWMNTCMLAPNGLYWDHVAADGTVDRREWSYNQGSPIAAYLLLYETTGDRSALARAEQLADGTLSAFSGNWLAEPPEFAAIFFRHLLELAAVDGRTRYVAAAETYADAAWGTLRDPQSGLFSTGLLGQAAFVQLYAHLALTESGAGARRSPPPGGAPTARGSGGAHGDRGRARPSPRTPPARAARSGRSSRTSR
jgi:mannose/cellobiose epimerase-like protein (N-acyl-D-glucosamine 2-epimerase family)